MFNKNVFHLQSKKISNREWETLTPEQRWRYLPEVSEILASCKWWKMSINSMMSEWEWRLPDDQLVRGLKRIKNHLLKVIDMLEGEPENMRGCGYIHKRAILTDMTKWWTLYMRDIVRMSLEGKFSPEARPFLARNLKIVAKQLQELINQLELGIFDPRERI